MNPQLSREESYKLTILPCASSCHPNNQSPVCHQLSTIKATGQAKVIKYKLIGMDDIQCHRRDLHKLINLVIYRNTVHKNNKGIPW